MKNYYKIGYFISGLFCGISIIIFISFLNLDKNKPKYIEYCKGGVIVNKDIRISPKIYIKYKFNIYDYNVSKLEFNKFNIGDTIK